MKRSFVWVSTIIFLRLAFSYAYATNVAVVISEDNIVYTQALEGVRGSLEVPFEVYQLEGSVEKGRTIASQIRSSGAAVVIVIGDKAAQAIKSEMSTTPIVFCIVMYPEEYGLLNQRNIYGVSVITSAQQQLSMLKRVAPQVKKIGVIYNPQKNQRIIDEAQAVAKQLGLQIVALQANTKAQVSEAIRELEGGKIDAFWMLLDPLVSNKVVFQVLLLFTFTEKLPLLVPVPAFVKVGGLLSLNADYRAMGRQAGRIANRIVKGTVSAGDIGMQFPDEVELAINVKTAKAIGIAIPESVLKEAVYIYKK